MTSKIVLTGILTTLVFLIWIRFSYSSFSNNSRVPQIRPLRLKRGITDKSKAILAKTKDKAKTKTNDIITRIKDKDNNKTNEIMDKTKDQIKTSTKEIKKVVKNTVIAIVGIVICVIVLLVVIVSVIYCCFVRNKN